MNLLDEFPRFSNHHTRTQALGMAVSGQTVVYVSTAGPGTAVKSIWSSLVQPRSVVDVEKWRYDLKGAKGLKSVYQGLPNSNFQHLVSVCAQPELLIAVNPVAARYWDDVDIDHVEQRQELLQAQLPGLKHRLCTYLNTQTDIPVLASWTSVLWDMGVEQGGIRELEAYGDCLGAWVIIKEFGWLELVQELLTANEIVISAMEVSQCV